MSVSSAEPELFIIFQVSILQQQLIRYFRTNTSYAPTSTNSAIQKQQSML